MEMDTRQYVVGIDVAKHAHVVCALAIPSGAIHLAPQSIAATRAGYDQLLAQLTRWGPPQLILLGLEATEVLWEPLYEVLTHAGYAVLVLNPRQTVSWAASLGLRAKTDQTDAYTLARGLAAGLARASTIPSDFVQSLRTLTRTRRDFVTIQTALEQHVHSELATLFPEFLTHLPMKANLKTPALLRLLLRYCTAEDFAQAPPEGFANELMALNPKRWTRSHAVDWHVPRLRAGERWSYAARWCACSWSSCWI